METFLLIFRTPGPELQAPRHTCLARFTHPRSPVTTIQDLLNHVRCKQLLLCAYHSTADDGAEPITLTDITSLLRIDSADCIALVRRLQQKGLVEPRPGGEPGAIQLTVKGQRFVERMSRATNTAGALQA